ncbi:hypothetical protein [Streptomyces rochei]|uniref:Uncharacterized protein n=1 Tax=Streptomyces rochei TaxID=1928 RepID=A0AAX3ZUN4_STRRO|nr:hypothetical protein [Streptomyces rochei]WMC90921.1 hypothetical protein P7W03_35315 [Streptomyces rochei]
MAGIARIAGVGRAAVAPAPTGGTATHPEFDRPAAVAWLLAHDKITVPPSIPSATLVLRGDGTGRELRCRLDARGFSWPPTPPTTTGSPGG